MKPVELTQSWQLLPAVCLSSHGFRNFRTSILTKTLYPVIKSIRADVVLYTLLVVRKSTDTAFHNQPELFISGNACCSHNLTSRIEVKCLHLVFPVNLSRVKCLHFLLVLWSQINDMSRFMDILRLNNPGWNLCPVRCMEIVIPLKRKSFCFQILIMKLCNLWCKFITRRSQLWPNIEDINTLPCTYSTVTLLARFLGLSTSRPLATDT